MTTISSASFTSPVQASVLQLQKQLAQAQTEISSGAPADLGLTLGARTGSVISLRSQSDQLTSYTTSNATATTRLDATSTALDAILSTAQGVSAALISASSTGGSTSTLAATAKAALQSLTAALNTSAGGEYVFGGTKTDSAPVADYFGTPASGAKQSIDAAFQTTFGTSQTSADASSITGAQLTSFLDGSVAPVFDGSGAAGTFTTASSSALRTTIAPSQSIATSVSANAGAFQSLAQAYSVLTEFTGSNLSADAQAAAVARATTLVNTGLADLTDVQSGVGVAQAAITSADSQLSAQATVLQTSAGDLDSVDTYALSSQVTTLQNQLEASYDVTSRLQQLSLVNYLNATG